MPERRRPSAWAACSGVSRSRGASMHVGQSLHGVLSSVSPRWGAAQALAQPAGVCRRAGAEWAEAEKVPHDEAGGLPARRRVRASGSSRVPLACGLTADTERLCDFGPVGTEPTKSSDLDVHGQRGGVAADYQLPQGVHVDQNAFARRPPGSSPRRRVPGRWSARRLTRDRRCLSLLL